jgi:hypothetical protein
MDIYGSLPFPFPVCCNQTEVAVFRYFRFPYIYTYAENGANRKRQLLFVAAKGKRKQQTSVCLPQTETENGSLYSLVGKR